MKLKGFIPPIRSAILGGGLPGDTVKLTLEVLINGEELGKLYDLRGKELTIEISETGSRLSSYVDGNGDKTDPDSEAARYL